MEQRLTKLEALVGDEDTTVVSGCALILDSFLNLYFSFPQSTVSGGLDCEKKDLSVKLLQ